MTTTQIEELREGALAQLFCLIDSFAGDGLCHTYGNGQTLDAADCVTELCGAFGIECEPGWWRSLAATITERSTPESEEAARAVLIEVCVEGKPENYAEMYRSGKAGFHTVDFQQAVRAMLRFAQQSAKPAEGWVCVPRGALDRLNSLATHSLGCAIYQRSWAAGEPRCTCGLYETRAMLSASPDRGEG